MTPLALLSGMRRDHLCRGGIEHGLGCKIYFIHLSFLHTAEMPFGTFWQTDVRAGTAIEPAAFDDGMFGSIREETELLNGRTENCNHPPFPRGGEVHQPGVVC